MNNSFWNDMARELIESNKRIDSIIAAQDRRFVIGKRIERVLLAAVVVTLIGMWLISQ